MDVRKTYPHADAVGEFTMFNIGGNKHRLGTYIHYRTGEVYITLHYITLHYIGSALFATLRAINPSSLTIRVLTTAKNLKPDFHVEAGAFRQQFLGAKAEVRSTGDFHDRFVVTDGQDYYHIGASIKDAGARAFLISRLQDPPVIAMLKTYLENTWKAATPLP